MLWIEMSGVLGLVNLDRGHTVEPRDDGIYFLRSDSDEQACLYASKDAIEQNEYMRRLKRGLAAKNFLVVTEPATYKELRVIVKGRKEGDSDQAFYITVSGFHELEQAKKMVRDLVEYPSQIVHLA